MTLPSDLAMSSIVEKASPTSEHKITSAINTLSRDNELVNVEELYRSGTLISETGEEDIADLNAAEALLMAAADEMLANSIPI